MFGEQQYYRLSLRINRISTSISRGSTTQHFTVSEQDVPTPILKSVRLKFSGGAGVVTPSKPPSPYEQLFPLPTPYFKMFLERSLNDPTTPLQAPFTATPLPIHHPFPSPLKKF